MANPTRRLLLRQTSMTAAAFGLLPALPDPQSDSLRPAPAAIRQAPSPMILHLDDAVTGWMTLFVGGREIALHDPGLAARLAAAAG